jgi:mono/diheme cytochrome c family protein
MKTVRGLGLVAAILLVVIGSAAQERKTEVKRVPAPMTSAASGQEMFVSYCASCHGKDAKGNGPAAASLKTAPADLTMLANKNDGKYPSAKVTSILRGETKLGAHGNQEMPVWGPVFWRISQGNAAEQQQRIANLNRYVESLQAK